MRVLLLTALLLSACLPHDEASVSQSGDVTGNSLTNTNSPNYIKAGECLVNINGVLELNDKTKTLLPLDKQQCLPSSKLSWLFRAEEVAENPKWKLPHLKLAILFDTSYSLQKQDAGAERFGILKTYLSNIFARKSLSGISTTEESGRIASAEIKIFPFKYCDQTKGDAHQLFIRQNTTNGEFMDEVDELIGIEYKKDGTPYVIGGNKTVKTDQRRANLKSYGAGGSTNYLESLAWAADFLDQESGDSTLKQVVIISDGLPFTYGSTILDDSCSFNTVDAGNRYSFGSTRARKCVTSNHSPSKNSCAAPSASDEGLTTLAGGKKMKAFDDPANHLLGMIQHSIVINTVKREKGFKVYAVHLNNCRNAGTATSFTEQYLCQNVSQPFFESFTTSMTKRTKEGKEVEISGYFPANDIDELDDALQGVLDSQLPTDPIAYKPTGTAYIDAPSNKNSSQLEVDDKTELYAGQRIKVGRNKGDTRAEGVQDYRDYGKHVLTVEHGLQGRGGNFRIGYDFEFAPLIPAAGKEGQDVVNIDACRSEGSDFFELPLKNLEVNKYRGTDYEVWCLLPPRCDADNQCCDEHNKYREITEDEGQQRCINEGQNLKWSTSICKCICDPKVRDRGCGKNQIWNEGTCSCETEEVVVETCVPSQTVCCKDGQAYQRNPEACAAKSGQIWDEDECACVPQPTTPIQQDCDSTRECCDGNEVRTSCPKGQVLKHYPACCVTVKPPVEPPPTCTKTCSSPHHTLNTTRCECVCDPNKLSCKAPKVKNTSSCTCVCPSNLRSACKGTFDNKTCKCTTTNPIQTDNGDDDPVEQTGGGDGGVQGSEPPTTEGIIWGKYEVF